MGTSEPYMSLCIPRLVTCTPTKTSHYSSDQVLTCHIHVFALWVLRRLINVSADIKCTQEDLTIPATCRSLRLCLSLYTVSGWGRSRRRWGCVKCARFLESYYAQAWIAAPGRDFLTYGKGITIPARLSLSRPYSVFVSQNKSALAGRHLHPQTSYCFPELTRQGSITKVGA